MSAACAQELPAPAVIPAVGAMKMIVSRKDAKTQRKMKNRRQLKRSGVFSSWILLLLCVFASLRETIAAPAPRALSPETEAKIRALLNAQELQAGRVGVLISALGTAATPQAFPAVPYDDKTQPVLFAIDADKRFTPASNMKLFTAAMALKVLGPEKTFATRIRQKAPEAYSLEIQGGGDPSFDNAGLEDLARQIAAQGIKKVEGISSSSGGIRAETFQGRYPDGWTLDDSLWYYGPPIGGLVFERNQIDLEISGELDPNYGGLRVEIKSPGYIFAGMKTRGSEVSDVQVNVNFGDEKLAGKTEDELLKVNPSVSSSGVKGLMVSGVVAPGQKLSLGLAVQDPEYWTRQAFSKQLQRMGVEVGDPPPPPPPIGDEPVIRRIFLRPRYLASHQSPPVRELLKRLLKNSDNLYAELLLRDAGLESYPPSSLARLFLTDTAKRGHQLIFDWLKENGVATDALKFTDGSGLSRYNLVTPRAVAGVLSAVEKVPGADAFWNALPIAGVDGTMKNRGKGTAMENNARAKSGTFSIVSCLSGYVTTRDNNRLSVVILTNFVPDGTAARRMQDVVFATLAESRF